MKRQLWGELSEEGDEATMVKQIEIDQDIMLDKRGEIYEYSCTFYIIFIVNLISRRA